MWNLKTNKQTNKKLHKLIDTENRVVAARDGGRGGTVSKGIGKMDEGDQKIQTMHNMVTIVNNTVLHI